MSETTVHESVAYAVMRPDSSNRVFMTCFFNIPPTPEHVPNGAIPITLDQYHELATNPHTRALVNGAVVTVETDQVPQTVSAAQTMLAFRALPGRIPGETMLTQITAALAASGDEDLKLAWARAATFSRTGTVVSGIAGLVSPPLSDDELNSLFIAAAEIAV